MHKNNLLSLKTDGLLHGADYNPDQWLHAPEILEKDIELMGKARCNVMSVGIFSWSKLEPEEGVFDFEWLDKILDSFAEKGIYASLSSPSGARPPWLAQKYPEVLRVQANRVRNLYGIRHNHCYTSPVYREKVQIINRKLAERYKDHPALLLWHISNEYGGECHCELCQEAFRAWLKNKYDNDLERLNHAWWGAFWSHIYTDWSQIESPAPHGENKVHGMNLDWKRFVTAQTIDFYRAEIAPIREVTPDIPVTTNFMESYRFLDYWKFAEHVDFISWNSYPKWHWQSSEAETASETAFNHDLYRSMKSDKPFLLMESTPSATNWQKLSKLKKPGMHLMSALQAIAHGSNSVQYFQWRKSRGASEKFHGAVVDHVGHEHTRVFRDVAQVGDWLQKLAPVADTTVQAETAVVFDWEIRWSVEDALGPRNIGLDYLETCKQHYRALWENGLPIDFINEDSDISKYKLIIAPMLYLVRPGFGEKVEAFVRNGGTFVATYWSGIVDESDLCFLDGFPGPLRKVLGIWAEEIDALSPGETNAMQIKAGSSLPFDGSFTVSELCDLIHAETAEVIGEYKRDFYAGRPALTVNQFGKGKAYYIAARPEEEFLTLFYNHLYKQAGVKAAIQADLPKGISAQIRENEEERFLFLMNFTNTEQQMRIPLNDNHYVNVLTDEAMPEVLAFKPFEVKVYAESNC